MTGMVSVLLTPGRGVVDFEGFELHADYAADADDDVDADDADVDDDDDDGDGAKVGMCDSGIQGVGPYLCDNHRLGGLRTRISNTTPHPASPCYPTSDTLSQI